MEERRRSQRHELDLRVVLHFDRPEDVADSRTADLSLHGVFLRTESEAKVGTKVYLELDVGPETIAIDGVVARVSEDPRGLGVDFLVVGEQVRAKLEELIG